MPIDTIVLHYTGMADAASAIGRLCDPRAAVSAHYVVEEDGNVWRLVEEEMRAFHAGVSYWRGHTALNGRSIGVEIVNPGHEFGYRGFPRVQMEAVLELCLGIQARHPIEARNVVAHSDVAPDRKQDPGELFDWRFLAEGGVGLWPEGVALDCRVARAARNDGVGMALAGVLGEIGYDVSLVEAVRAFQLHWRPGQVDGVADGQTLQRACEVIALIKRQCRAALL